MSHTTAHHVVRLDEGVFATVRVDYADYRDGRAAMNRRPRLYVWGDEDAYPAIHDATLLSISKDTAAEWNPINRRIAQMRKQLVARPVVQHVTRMEGDSLRWSARAGCSCGCSPAFVWDGPFGFELFVHVYRDQPVSLVRVSPRVRSRTYTMADFDQPATA